MSKGLRELIEKFESKKEFREVKLRHRQSFREDQAALEHRLSKYRNSVSSLNSVSDSKDMSNGDANGHDHDVDNGKNGENELGVESKLENIVLDINEEKTNGNTVSESDKDVNMDLKNGLIKNGGDDIKSNTDSKDETIIIVPQVSNGQEYPKPHMNGAVMNGQAPVPTHTNGGLTNGGLTNGGLTNGHVVRQKESSSLIDRPTRTAVTPEPRHSSLRGIYQKNPKLTPSSTDHLDNVSLTGFRVSGQSSLGHKVDPQRTTVPPIPSAEVTSLPGDGNVGDFSVEQMVTFFRLLRLPEERVYRLSKCNVDGKRFSVFSDKELKELGMNNPIIRYFRDRTAQRPKKRVQKFML